MRLYRQTVEDFGLYTGKELTEAEMEDLRTAAGKMSAKMRAVRIVAASGVSRQDLESRLIHKGESRKNAREAVQWMEDMGLVDDRTTAQQIVQRCARQGYGPQRVKQKLFEKGVPRDLWDDALATLPDPAEAIVRLMAQFEPDAKIDEALVMENGCVSLTACTTDKFGEGVHQWNVMLLSPEGDLLILSGYNLEGDDESVHELLDALLAEITLNGADVVIK